MRSKADVRCVQADFESSEEEIFSDERWCRVGFDIFRQNHNLREWWVEVERDTKS